MPDPSTIVPAVMVPTDPGCSCNRFHTVPQNEIAHHQKQMTAIATVLQIPEERKDNILKESGRWMRGMPQSDLISSRAPALISGGPNRCVERLYLHVDNHSS